MARMFNELSRKQRGATVTLSILLLSDENHTYKERLVRMAKRISYFFMEVSVVFNLNNGFLTGFIGLSILKVTKTHQFPCKHSV